MPQINVSASLVCLFASVFSLCAGVTISYAAEPKPADVWKSAAAAWHFGPHSADTGSKPWLRAEGEAHVAMPLSEADRDASLLRGGDGYAAELAGGWLNAGTETESTLKLTGDQFTAAIRMKLTGRWVTRGIFTRGGGHDQLVLNFFSHDFGDGMSVGCEIGIAGRPGLGGQVRTLVDRIGGDNWLDLVARYDGRKFMLFVDGVPLDEREVTGVLRTGNREPLAIGAATSGGFVDRPIRGRIDHAGIWNRALSDAEIVAISGGSEFVSKRRAVFAAYVQSPRVTPAQSLVNESRELKARFQADKHRPRFHFLIPEEGDAMPADPNGAVYYKGRYHLFYIFQRHQQAEPHVVHCWGHASSIDLLHWEHHPTALDVAPNDPDRGIFSGNLYLDAAGTPTILYHGVSIGNAIATSSDPKLIAWTKNPRNPIVPIPKQGDADFGKYESWDPHGWYDADSKTYFAIFGGKKPALFRGPEITQLKFVGPFLPNDKWSGPDEDVSCPDFFPFGDEHMLLCISHYKGARYFLGSWKDGAFTPRTHGRMNWPGGAFFAPETLIDGRGRRILWAWVLDPRDTSVRVAQGWSGVMSAPRLLSPDGAGGVRIEPVEELKRLRVGDGVSLGEAVIPKDGSIPAKDVAGDCLDIEAELIPSKDGDVGIQVRCSPDLKEHTTIAYNAENKTLRIDFQHSSLDDSIEYRSYVITPPNDPALARRLFTVQEAPLELAPNEPLRLRILLDRSMLEVFANGRQCVTQRIFPTRADSLAVNLFATGQPAKLVSLQAWEMAASNAE